MDIQNQLTELSARIPGLKDQLQTEEATKTAFILPFIRLLGYDIFNPAEVIPEFTADIGLKKGEKVDYAIFQDGSPILIIECKHWKENLSTHNSQLIRYFHVSKTRFALLTNGIIYRFFTDLEKTNVMDERPFLEFDITNLRESHINELTKFHKSNFDINKIVSNASSLKYTREIKRIFNNELHDISPELVRFFAAQVYKGRLTEKVMKQFSEIVQKAISQIISESVNDRLQRALNKEKEEIEEEEVEVVESKIITTEEELNAFEIVKAILSRKVDVSRVFHRDTQSYFGILLDDNNRKPICRLYLDGKKKYIILFTESKQQQKVEIASINRIYDFEKELLGVVELYDNF